MAGLLVREGGRPVGEAVPARGTVDGADPGRIARLRCRTTARSLYRRSLYTFWKRTIPPPSMANFDAPSRESCIVQRGLTNSPLQALNLMNDVTFLEAARLSRPSA